nr:M56 family metallopeptidase [uncultured Aminipila sp.]
MLHQLFLSIIEISIITSVIIVTVKILSYFIYKHYAAKWKKWIWLIIAVRLLIPIEFTFSGAPIQVNIPDTNNPFFISLTNPISPYKGTVQKSETEVLPEMSPVSDTQVEKFTDSVPEKNVPWMDITISVWVIGCFVFIVHHFVGYLYFRKQIFRWSRVLKEQRSYDIINDISTKFGIKKLVDVYVCDQIASPSIMGFFRPVVVIPSGHYSDEELTFIFKHELTHYRRYDLWYKMLLLLSNAIHWFNPMIYLLRYEAYVDLEFSCDDEVIKGMSTDVKKAYGETILSCINQQKMRKIALTTCFSDTTKTLKERLQNILSTRKKHNGLIIIFTILLLIVSTGAAVAFTGGEQNHKNADGFSWYGAVNLISKEIKLPEELIESDDDWNTFLGSDRTIALVADIPKEAIYVYGLKENGTEEGTYSLHGICIKQGNDIQVLDIDWGVYGELPKLQYEDYDNDGIKELAMISKSANGTGISLNDLHILERSNTNGWTDYSFGSDDWSDIINNKLAYQVEDGTLTIAINGEDTGDKINLKSLEEKWGYKLNSIYVGNYGEFNFKDGKIYLQVLPTASVDSWATPQLISETYIQMEVLYYKGEFELKNASEQSN